MKVCPEFTNFIAKDYLDDADNVNHQDIINYAHELRSKGPGKEISNCGGWHSHNLDLDNEPRLKPLVTALEAKLNELHTYLGFTHHKVQKIGNMWININKRGDHNIVHTHPDSFFSGCFYLKVPENSGRIVYINPIESHVWAINTDDVEERNSYNSKLLSIDPHAGLVLFFPPWLQHYVMASETDEERISIAFNSDIVRKDLL